MLAKIDLRDPMGVRDFSALVVMQHTGLRVSELVGLDVSDVFYNGQARLRLFVRAAIAKGGRERAVPLNAVARQAIDRLVAWNRSRGFSIAPNAPLFMTKKHNRLTARAVQYIVQGLREACGLSVPVTTFIPPFVRH